MWEKREIFKYFFLQRKNQTSNICSKCFPSYSNKSIKCDDGFSLYSGICLINTVKNCRLTDSQEFGSCLACEPGYEFLEKKCVFIQAKSMICKSRNLTGDCASCFSGYSLSNGVCSPSQITNQIEGCINYDHHGYLCVECDFHLTLTNGVFRGKQIKNCQILSQDQGHCLVCKSQYFLKGYSCVPRFNLNCLETSPDQDQCLSCHLKSFLKNGQCKPYTSQNCRTFSRIKD